VNNVFVVDSQETPGNFVNTKMGVKNMKRTFAVSLFVIAVLALMVGRATAGKPSTGGVFNGNGFPSGPHYNLNILAKWCDFLCPPAPEVYWLKVVKDINEDGDIDQLVEVCDEGDECVKTNKLIYGGVVFIPREPCDDAPEWDDITILMESGTKGPKRKADTNTMVLQVTDWCTESFGDDSAVVQLPADPDGYAVYARITGKPGEDQDDHTINISPSLSYVEDEAGNDLILLGFVRGAQVFNSLGEELPLRRTDDSKNGKGVRKATNITPLFQWTGEVCYIDYEYYCPDEDLDGTPDDCTQESFCCVDMDGSGDDVYEHCDLLSEVGPLECPAQYEEEGVFYDYVPVETWCRQYTNHWIFNIADFVGYLWDITSNGAYHVQVRFYPLPLNTK
jgi:hypothetical protein